MNFINLLGMPFGVTGYAAGMSSAEHYRLYIFLGLLGLFILLEAVFPRKRRTQPRLRRWATNMAILVLGGAAGRLLAPMAAISAAIYVHVRGWGLFNLLELPLWTEIILAIILLDLAIYAQHVAFHRWRFFWQFHKVHHADRDIDASTALRFHPIEIVFSILYKSALCLLLGPAVIAVVLFEIILNGMAMFNHANLRLPLWLDKIVRALLVTPDMHRVHHSDLPSETHSNFGFNLSVWDRVFKTYTAQPKAGHDDMVIGLPEYQNEKPSSFWWSIELPFRR